MEEEGKKKGLFKGKLFQKIRSIKHIEIIVAVILGAIILLIYLSTFNSGTSKSATYESTNTTEYATMLEEKLSLMLGQIDGAGTISVMITLQNGPEYVYATNDEEKVNSTINNGNTTTSTTTSSEPIVISNDIVVVKEIMPTVSGVVVVSSGAGDTKVKLEILKAIQALLNVPQANIEILVGK